MPGLYCNPSSSLSFLSPLTSPSSSSSHPLPGLARICCCSASPTNHTTLAYHTMLRWHTVISHKHEAADVRVRRMPYIRRICSARQDAPTLVRIHQLFYPKFKTLPFMYFLIDILNNEEINQQINRYIITLSH